MLACSCLRVPDPCPDLDRYMGARALRFLSGLRLGLASYGDGW